MKEELLQYIWKFQHFNNAALTSTDGDTIQLVSPGTHNVNQGPDFTDAKIKINNTLWAGNIELHVQSSHWNQHKHSADSNFNNVILHVVWHHDAEIKDISGNSLPTLELQNRVPKLLLEKYRQFMSSIKFIPCENNAPTLSDLALSNWKHRLVAERLIRKSNDILLLFDQSNHHWEETFWWLVASNFGLKINAGIFRKIAMSLPQSLLAKHKTNIVQIEALLFGQAGLLDHGFTDKYPQMLQKEYEFYKKKYGLVQPEGNLFFLRMRPANFPTLRLAQLAKLISGSEHLFSKIKESGNVNDVKKFFEVEANDYWHYHYVFDETSEYKIKSFGKSMVNNILINTVIPVLFAYGLHHGEETYKTKAVDWLGEIAAEKNSITKGFEELGYSNKDALDSQAFIQLKNEYCDKRLCLQCAIGNSILKDQS